MELLPDSSSQAPLNDSEGGVGMAVRLPRYARNDGGMWKDLEKRFFDCGCACAQNDRAELRKDLQGGRPVVAPTTGLRGWSGRI